MDGHHMRCTCGRCLGLRDVQVVVVVADVDDDRPSARLEDRFEGRGEGARRNDHALFLTEP